MKIGSQGRGQKKKFGGARSLLQTNGVIAPCTSESCSYPSSTSLLLDIATKHVHPDISRHISALSFLQYPGIRDTQDNSPSLGSLPHD